METKTLMSNKVYDILKWCCLIVMPSASTLYSQLAPLWNLPYADAIPETITAVSIFIGAAIGIASLQYNKTLGGK